MSINIWAILWSTSSGSHQHLQITPPSTPQSPTPKPSLYHAYPASLSIPIPWLFVQKSQQPSYIPINALSSFLEPTLCTMLFPLHGTKPQAPLLCLINSSSIFCLITPSSTSQLSL